MAIVEPAQGPSGLIERVKNILLQPSAEWSKIDQERPSTQQLLFGYVAPLAGLAVLAGLIGQVVFGVSVLGVTYRPDVISAVTSAVVGFVLSLAGVWLLSLIIDFFAPNFGGVKDPAKAMQVAAYGSTAGYLAGVFSILPALGILGILGLYSIYLIYKGLPQLMRAPQDKALGYTALVVVTALVLGIILGSLAACVGGVGRLAMGAGSVVAAGDAGKVTLPGGTEINIGEMERAAKELEAATKSMEVGAAADGSIQIQGAAAGPLVDVEQLKALLPESLPGGLARTEVTSGSGGMMGFSAAGATGVYTAEGKRVELMVGDMGPAGAFAAMAGAMGMQSTSETADGFTRMQTVNGELVMEETSKASNTAQSAKVVAKRFLVSAEGSGVGIDEVREAVKRIDASKLEALGKAG